MRTDSAQTESLERLNLPAGTQMPSKYWTRLAKGPLLASEDRSADVIAWVICLRAAPSLSAF